MERVALLQRALLGAGIILALGLVSDRLRPVWGALLASVPTTTAVSMYSIARDQGAAFAAHAANSSLVAQAGNLAFVCVFAALALAVAPARRAWVMAAAVLAYFAVVLPYLWMLHGQEPSLALNLVGYTAVLGVALVTRNWIRGRPAKEKAYGRPAMKASHWQRALLGGSLVVVASILADRLGPHWGGIFASFPITFMSLLLVAYPNRSLPYFLEQSLGVVPSTLNLVAFILAVHWAYPRLGPGWGTLVAYVAFAAVAVPMAWANLRVLRHTDALLSEDAILKAATDEPQ